MSRAGERLNPSEEPVSVAVFTSCPKTLEVELEHSPSGVKRDPRFAGSQPKDTGRVCLVDKELLLLSQSL